MFVCVYIYHIFVLGKARVRHWESSSKTDFIPLRQGLSLNLELTVLG